MAVPESPNNEPFARSTSPVSRALDFEGQTIDDYARAMAEVEVAVADGMLHANATMSEVSKLMGPPPGFKQRPQIADPDEGFSR